MPTNNTNSKPSDLGLSVAGWIARLFSFGFVLYGFSYMLSDKQYRWEFGFVFHGIGLILLVLAMFSSAFERSLKENCKPDDPASHTANTPRYY